VRRITTTLERRRSGDEAMATPRKIDKSWRQAMVRILVRGEKIRTRLSRSAVHLVSVLDVLDS
jgi:hypothetical protein